MSGGWGPWIVCLRTVRVDVTTNNVIQIGCQDNETSCLLQLCVTSVALNVQELSYGWQHASSLTQAIFEPLTVGVVQVPPHTPLHINTHIQKQHTHAHTHTQYMYCSIQYIYTFIYIRSSMTKAGLKFSTIVQSIQSVIRV